MQNSYNNEEIIKAYIKCLEGCIMMPIFKEKMNSTIHHNEIKKVLEKVFNSNDRNEEKYFECLLTYLAQFDALNHSTRMFMIAALQNEKNPITPEKADKLWNRIEELAELEIEKRISSLKEYYSKVPKEQIRDKLEFDILCVNFNYLVYRSAFTLVLQDKDLFESFLNFEPQLAMWHLFAEMEKWTSVLLNEWKYTPYNKVA